MKPPRFGVGHDMQRDAPRFAAILVPVASARDLAGARHRARTVPRVTPGRRDTRSASRCRPERERRDLRAGVEANLEQVTEAAVGVEPPSVGGATSPAV
jgi:hypothetical protein